MATEATIKALQAQVETLQHINSALTRDLCLKENYVELKDQQFRVMQRRLEELEGSVAQWKDRWLQAVNAQHASYPLINDKGDDVVPTDRVPPDWTVWHCKTTTLNRTKAVAKAMAKVATLSQRERNQVQPLLVALEHNGGHAMDEIVFTAMSEELSRVLLLYLLPALLDAMDSGDQHDRLQCFSRKYAKPTLDFRVRLQESASSPTAKESALAFDTSPFAGLEAGERSEETVASTAHELEETLHLFDYVELDRHGCARPCVPHGPRELHATKAMFISHPLTSTRSNGAVGMDKSGEKPSDKTSRRYTLTPKRINPTFAVETRRTHTLTMGALPSPCHSSSSASSIASSSMNVMPVEHEVMAMPCREKDGKIKKIVGSVFDRLSRHKSHQSLVPPSGASSSPNGTVSGSVQATQLASDQKDALCDGCGRGPLVIGKWICRSCRVFTQQDYALCEKCYGQGLHGLYQENALFARIEAIVVQKCPQLGTEMALLFILRTGICKANVKKFSFCLTWIADLLQCHRTTELRARALEITTISTSVRSEFVRLLRDLIMRCRPDIELHIEWEPAAGTQHDARRPGLGPDTPGLQSEEVAEEVDTLRIRVKDATTSLETVSRSGVN